MARKVMVILAGGVTALTLSGSAMAGGWATTTVDDAPDEFHAGATHEITYTVLQHGRTPVNDSTALVFRPAKGTMSSASEIVFMGFPTGEPGQYRAHVEVPVAGVWLWEVRQGVFGTLELGSVDVADVDSGISLPGWGVIGPLIGGIVLALLGLILARLRHAERPSSAPASRITSST